MSPELHYSFTIRLPSETEPVGLAHYQTGIKYARSLGIPEEVYLLCKAIYEAFAIYETVQSQRLGFECNSDFFLNQQAELSFLLCDLRRKSLAGLQEGAGEHSTREEGSA